MARGAAIPLPLLAMLLAVEDKRFALHPGVDPIAIGRSTLANLLYREITEGASTLTQQLYDIRRTAAGDSRPRTWSRKCRQALWAVRYELRHSKIEILREYLGGVYWGRSYWGLDAAADGYFNSRREDLLPSQAFFLAERLAAPNIVIPNRVIELLRRQPVIELLRFEPGAAAAIKSDYFNVFGWRFE